MEVPEDEEAPGQLGGDVERQRHWSRSEARFWFVSLFCGTCLLYCARMAMPVCAVSMATAFHWSKIDTGLVLGGFFWGYCFTQILGGHASDKVGGERVLVLSAASWSTVTMVTPLLSRLSSHSVLSMTLARFLMGLLQGVFFPSLASLCSQRVLEAERGGLMSAIHSGTYLGSVRPQHTHSLTHTDRCPSCSTLLAGGLGSVLLEHYSWELLFYSVGAMSGLWALVVSNFLLRDEKVMVQKKPQGTMSRTRWLSLCQKPSVWSLVLTHTCMCSSSYMLLSWLPTYFDETFPMESVRSRPTFLHRPFTCLDFDPSHASERCSHLVRAPSTTWSPGWWPSPWCCVPDGCPGSSSAEVCVCVCVCVCAAAAAAADSRTRSPAGHSLSTVRKVMQFIAMAVSSLFLVLLSGTTSITAAVTYVTIAVSASTFSSCGTSVNVQDLTPSCAGALYGFMNMLGAFMGLLTVSFSGYLIEVTSSWAMVFSLITLINTVGLGIFLVFGDTRRVDLDLHSTVGV
ncbi:voltage-gated purine nucleotide uniporter SLC17A9-like [Synchiropus picturatus]